MEDLFIKGTAKKPTVKFDAKELQLSITGRAIPEPSDAYELYKPIFDKLNEYADYAKVNNNITLVVNFQLEYFNTHSSKIILDIFKKLENINKKGHSVLVNWLYEIDDEDSLIAGEDYQSILKLPFNMIEIPD